MKKRILSLVLVLCMLVPLLTPVLSVSAASPTPAVLPTDDVETDYTYANMGDPYTDTWYTYQWDTTGTTKYVATFYANAADKNDNSTELSDEYPTFTEGETIRLWIGVSEVETRDILATAHSTEYSDWNGTYYDIVAPDLPSTDIYQADAVYSAGAAVTSGTVRLTLPDGELVKLDLEADGFCYYDFTVPYGLTTADLSAKYVSAAAECVPAEANDVPVNTVTISGASASFAPATTPMLAGGSYELTVSGVKDAAGTDLVAGTDYTVAYYVMRDGETDWTADGTGDTYTADVKSTADKFKAVVTPAGDYTRGEFELLAPGASLNEIKTYGISTLGTTLMAGTEGNLFVTFDDLFDNAITVGTVTMFDNGALYDTVEIDTYAMANFTFSSQVPGAHTLTFTYSGAEGVYKPKTIPAGYLSATYTITTNDLAELANWTLADDTDTAITALTPGVATTLKALPDAAYTYGVDYETVWYMSTNGGLTWVEMYAGEHLESINAIPMTADYQYKAEVIPMGAYDAANGFILVGPATCATNKGTSVTTLTVDNDTPYENEFITLTAAVTEENGYVDVLGGTVTFYAGTDAIGTVSVDAAGQAILTVKSAAYDEGNSVIYTATYNGNGSLDVSTSADLTITPKSVSISTDGDFAIVATPDVEQDVETVLSIPAVLSLEGDPLDYGTHYVVDWYVDYDGNGDYVSIYGTDTLTVTPATPYESYRAVIIPKTGVGSNFTDPVNGIALDPTVALGDAGLYETEVTIDLIDEETNAVTTDPVTGEVVSIRALVEKTDDSSAVPEGMVTFYFEGTVIGSAPVDANGYATLKGITADLGEITAEYGGTKKYAPSTGTYDLEPSSQTITLNGETLTVLDDTAAAVAEPYTVLTDYTLVLPEVYATDDLTTPLTAGVDYTVNWYKYDGSNWAAIYENSDVTELPVNAASTDEAYKAVVMPAGTFTLPTVGLQAGTVTFETVMETVVTLSASADALYPTEELVLTADITDANGNVVPMGEVAFYITVNGGTPTYLGVSTVNSQGKAEFATVIPAYVDEDPDLVYSATYYKNESYEEGISNTVTVTQKSDAIIWAAGSELAIYEGDSATGTPVTDIYAGQTYTLAIPEVASLDGLTAVEAGVDYIVRWYYTKTEGAAGDNWILMEDTDTASTTIRVDPETKDITYKALVYPILAMQSAATSFMKRANDGTDYVPFLESDLTAKTGLTETTTDLTLSVTEEFEESVITLTAEVTETVSGDAVTYGSVAFYLDNGVDPESYVGTVALNELGMAQLDVTVPAYVIGYTDVNYRAEYLENDTYAASDDTETLTVLSRAIIWAVDDTITIYEGDSTSGAVVTDMYAAQTYTLQVTADSMNPSMDAVPGTDYYVVWFRTETEGNPESNWVVVEDTDPTSNTLRVDPDKVNYSYKAQVYPMGIYNKTYDGTEFGRFLESQTTNKTALTETETLIEVTGLNIDEAADADLGFTADHLAQFEGQTVTIEATVYEEGTTTAVNQGLVDFYADGVKLNHESVELVDGKAKFVFTVGEYDEALDAIDNFSTLSVTYLANSAYETSTSDDVDVYVKSTEIDVPVIYSSLPSLTTGETDTELGILNGLPAGKEITFSVIDIFATDGRAVAEGDYALIWQKATASFDNYAFADQAGEDKDEYTVSSGATGNSFRLSVIPQNNMVTGAYSLQANIGEKIDVTVDLVPEIVFDTATAAGFADGVEVIDGSHEGDTVTLTVTVTAPDTQEDRPTGFVRLSYDNLTTGDTDVEIGRFELAEPDNTDASKLESVITMTTDALPEGKLTIKAEYLGDEVYNVGDDDETYKVWSVDLAPVTIESDPADSPLIADEEYVFTLDDVYTDNGQLLFDGTTDDPAQYYVQWQVSVDNGMTWADLTEESNLTLTQTPATENYVYRAVVTTNFDLYNDQKPSLESVAVSNEIGSTRNETVLYATTDVPAIYQSNEVTIYAISDDPITGYVEFYWTDYREDGNYYDAVWEPVVSADPDATNVAELTALPGSLGMAGTQYASIVTDSLPVSDDGTYRQFVFRTDYLGDKTYKPASNAADYAISASETGTAVDSDMLTVYSSVIAANETEGEPFYIMVNGGRLIADQADTILELHDVFTLDYLDDGDGLMTGDIFELSELEDYTIEWQYCAKYDAGMDNWTVIPDSTNNMTVILTPIEGYAYRAKITARNDSEKVKESYNTDQSYYSNILIVENAQADLNVAISPASSAAYDKDDVTLSISMFGGETTPDGLVQVTIIDTRTGETVKYFENNTVNGMVDFLWEEAPAGTYRVETVAQPNNGYNDFEGTTYTDVQEYIVLFRAPDLAAETKTVTYDGQVRNFVPADVTISGLADDLIPMAEEELVFLCYDAEGNLVEAKDAGTYDVKIYLPQSRYWEESFNTVSLVIEQREVSVIDVEFQNKIYDGKTDVCFLGAVLEDAVTDQAGTGLPTNDTGVIHGDGVYAIGTLAAADAAAGDTEVTFTFTSFEGPDAANYKFAGTYSEPITIERSQLKGAIADITFLYVEDEEGTALAHRLRPTDVYLIDQTGAQLNDYTLTYYYHDGTGVKLVDAIAEAGMYTVIANGNDNYKGGAVGTVYVSDLDGAAESHGTIDTAAYKSALLYLANTQETYGANTGVTVTCTNGTAEVEYFDGSAYTETVPENVGRYIVRATNTTTGDVAYGTYTINKAAAEEIIPSVAGKVYDNTPVTVANEASFPAGTYFTYIGGQLTEISYEAPSDAGVYTVTAHIPATENTAATEYSSSFTIDKRLVTVRCENAYAELYTNNPVWDLRFENLAEGDNSIDDLIAQPQVDVAYDSHRVGLNPITMAGAIADNYIFEYVDTDLSVIAHDPEQPLEIYGEPDGTIYYGDTFTLALYGNTGNYVSHDGYNTNNSSDIYWSLTKAAGFVGDVTIDERGFVDVDGVGEFTVTAVRGNGDLAIYTEKTFVAEKKVVTIVIPDTWYVYDATAKSIPYASFSYEGLVEGGETIAEAEVTIYDNSRTNVGSQIVSAEVTGSDYYVGTGAGLLTVTHKDAKVTITSTASMIYGNAVPNATFTKTESGAAGSDELISGGKSVAYIYSNTDTGVYALVNGNWTENQNYHISYVDNTSITSNKRNLTITTGSLADTEDGSMVNVIGGTFQKIGDRMFGEENQIMSYSTDTAAPFVAGDTLADLDLTNIFVDYTRLISSHANRPYADDEATRIAGTIPTPRTDDITTDDADYEIVNGTVTSLNYIVNFDIGSQHIYQRPFALDIDPYIPVFYGEDAFQAMKDATEVTDYNGIGGLAEKLDHTIDDLDLIFDCTDPSWSTTAPNGTKYTFSVENGNKDYWMEEPDTAVITIEYEKLVAWVYNESGMGFTTILYRWVVNPDLTVSKIPTHLSVPLNYRIVYAGTDIVVEEGTTVKQSTTGVYKATYNITNLTGDFEIILSAEGYRVVR